MVTFTSLSALCNFPPALTTASILTHVDLPISMPLATLALDREDDSVYFHVLVGAHGNIALSADGRSVTFTPAPAYFGPATFYVQADDGFGASPLTMISVNVSNAPLVNLDFETRLPRLLNVGETENVVMVGDFSDQQGVSLPGSYVAFTSTRPDIFSIASNGQILGIGKGSGELLASAQGLLAATAVSVDVPQDLLPLSLYVLGLGVYPQAVALPPTGQRHSRRSQPTAPGHSPGARHSLFLCPESARYSQC